MPTRDVRPLWTLCLDPSTVCLLAGLYPQACLLLDTLQASLKLGEQLATRNDEIAKRKSVVEGELSKAEPALIEAQKSVNSIKKPQLDELRWVASHLPQFLSTSLFLMALLPPFLFIAVCTLISDPYSSALCPRPSPFLPIVVSVSRVCV